MLRIGAQISSIKAYLNTPGEVLQSFRKLREIGYRVVQLQWIAPSVPNGAIADALKETGLVSVSTQDYYEEVVKDLPRVLALNELCGSTRVCVSGIPGQHLSKDGVVAFAETLSALSGRLQAGGKTLVFHPRQQEFVRFGGVTAMDILLENTPDALDVLPDLYHIVRAGEDPIAWLHKLRGRMDMVHCKDSMVDADGAERLMPLGQGRIDWPPILRACEENGVLYAFAEQETWQKDAFDCMRESFDYLEEQGLVP